MKLLAEINGEETEIVLLREGDELRAEVDGRSYDVELSSPEPGVFLFKLGNKVYEAAVNEEIAKSGKFRVAITNEEFEIGIRDPKSLRGMAGSAGVADGIVEIRSQMPGKVVRLLVSEGEAVTADQGVIVVEAMKMQNELKSPKDGVVKEIRFAESDTVNAGETLVVIE